MAGQAEINVEIKVNGKALADGALKVGGNPQPPNTITLGVANGGNPVRWTPQNPLRLTLSLGETSEALFLSAGDARDCKKSVPSDWKADWSFPSDATGVLTIYSFRKALERDATLEIRFDNVISKANPEGAARMTLQSADPPLNQEFSIRRAADRPDIIFFVSDPPAGVRNLPGDEVTLRWRTSRLTSRELTRVAMGEGELPCDFSRDEGAKIIADVSVDTTFRLAGYPEGGAARVSRELTVSVLRQGWYDLRNTILEGDPGYPSPANDVEDRALATRPPIHLEPTLLLNDNDLRLYGVFRHDFRGTERALLFQNTNPFGSWKLVRSSVPDQKGAIPEGFSTSPGVYFDDAVWLIGGSQIDPEIASNGVWRLDLGKGRWEHQGAAEWAPRMGHAVLVFQNRIWVLGGRDEVGNALNDVWRLDLTSKKWTSLGNAPWAPRCLFGPAVFNDQIWLYGGAREPFSSVLYDDVHVYRNDKWDKLAMTELTGGAMPIASCLQVFNNRLCLFGKFRTVYAGDKSEKLEPLAFSLSTPSTRTWDSFPNDGLKDWGGETTFSYRLINYRGKMLIAAALGFEAANPAMKIYVPGS
jgi:hypothetical protein